MTRSGVSRLMMMRGRLAAPPRYGKLVDGGRGKLAFGLKVNHSPRFGLDHGRVGFGLGLGIAVGGNLVDEFGLNYFG